MKYNNSSLNFFMEWKLIKKSVLDCLVLILVKSLDMELGSGKLKKN